MIMASIDRLEETDDVEIVNEKLHSGWILLEILCNSANQSVKYIIAHKRPLNQLHTPRNL